MLKTTYSVDLLVSSSVSLLKSQFTVRNKRNAACERLQFRCGGSNQTRIWRLNVDRFAGSNATFDLDRVERDRDCLGVIVIVIVSTWSWS